MKNLALCVGAALLALSVALSGCVVIESSAIGGRGGSGQAVTASSSDYGILALTAPYGLTAAANSQLAAQCRSGKLTNVQTELSMRNFIVVQLYNVSANAVCE